MPEPQLVGRILAMAGVAGLVWWGLIQSDPAGSSFSVGLSLGAMIVQYDPDPFWLPLYGILAGILVVTQLLGGNFTSYLGGVVLGLALPYLLFRLKGVKP